MHGGLDERKRLVAGVLDSLADQPAGGVRLLAQALSMAEQPLAEFSQPFDYWADALEFPDVSGGRGCLADVVALKFAARHPDMQVLLERLQESEAPHGTNSVKPSTRSPATHSWPSA